MFSQQLQQRTACLLLVLMGLVGGLGTGLHNLFDGCHHCDCDSEFGSCSPKSADQSCGCTFCEIVDGASSERGEAEIGKDCPTDCLAKSDEHCAICQLLSAFNTTTGTRSWQHFVYGNRGALSITVPFVRAGSSLRLEPPRGPPADAFSDCAV